MVAIMIKLIRRSKYLALALCCGLFLAPSNGVAEDIDIFIGSSGGAAANPKVTILLDNSTNDLFAAKLDAISLVLDSITSPTDVGLALWGGSTAPKGAYLRFGPRDISIAANRTALKNILALIKSNNESAGSKNEPEGFYEIYKFYSGLAPYAGTLARNPNADKAGNSGTYAGATPFAQGLTSGFAIKGVGGNYDNGIVTDCGKNYIIYIAANNGFSPADVAGASSYEGLSVAPALPGFPLYWGDEWTRFLYNNKTPQIITYVLDAASVGNDDAAYTSILQAEAKQGGGTWQFVSTQAQIVTALLKVLAEIKAVNTTFASASLPVNATNRAQNQNQVFIGMFRPDPGAKPRWFGNLKQYQLINIGGSIDLADVNAVPAVNPVTGFLTDCATSFWTTDSGTYWQNVPITPVPAGNCVSSTFNKFSDSPDGAFVEKGAVAEVIRKGNNPPTTNTTPTYAVNRTVYTLSGSTLTAFNKISSGLPQSVVDFTLGTDVNDENANTNVTETRPSLHGDVIHSRPLPLNYGGTTGVVIYYGANDGTLRAVSGNNGKELWAFVAPESFPSLTRLLTNSPLMNYPNLPAGVTPTPQPKDYFFDGSVGAFQNIDNTKVWIYPTMRRGGRVIYAFDVTNPASPSFKWKVGCPNLANDTGCSTGTSGIGQTWSTPIVAFIKGYSTAVPILIVGGGYDTCEDQNTATPTCTTPKGAGVYILNGNDGTVLASFSTTRSVVADVSLIDIDNDGAVDYAYVVDTGGNIYRIDFIDGFTTRVPLDQTKWTMKRVAYTNGAFRKFLFPPALLLNSGNVYVAVGSGDREHPLSSQYPYVSGVVNRFYVFKDDLAANLSAINLDDTTLMIDNTTATTCGSAQVTPTSAMKGWFMNLNQNGPGEQTVTSAVITGGLVTFSTNRPIPPAAGTCSTTLGEARGYFLNLLNGSGAIGVAGSCGGTRSGIFVGGGLPPSPVLGTIPVGGVPKTVLIGAIQRSGAGSSPIQGQQVRPPISSIRKRIFWYTPGSDN